MAARVIALVGAGEMGSALGACLRQRGVRVVVALRGRSERTRGLAAAAGLEDVGSLDALLDAAHVVLSVVPPGAAIRVAEAIAASHASRRPLVVDLNAVAPATVEAIGDLLARAGIDLVDGSSRDPRRARAA